jgi:NAD(P)H-hydrate epimerase
MKQLEPAWLYTAAQSRAVDRCAIEEHGLPGPGLMARAARAAFARLLAEAPAPEFLQVLCGPGNNGGDGLLLALLASGRGMPLRVFLVDGPARSPDAQRAEARLRAAGVEPEPYVQGALEARGVIVDAMLGTGIRGALRERYAAAVAEVNALGVPVLALDVPTGVDSDSGAVVGEAVRATGTLSFITMKRGLFTGAGAVHAGQRSLATLDVPAAAYAVAGPAWEHLSLDRELPAFPRRDAGQHKGDFGRCLVVGGDRGMGGAVILAAEAALRCGAGLCRVATRSEHIAPLLARRPEAMATVVEHRNDLEALLPWADVVVLGPGLGTGPWGEQLLRLCLDAAKPLVLDADALNLLARWQAWPLPPGCVITPHPGEAARLLEVSTTELQADRFAAARSLAERCGAAVILKGQGSLVYADGQGALCSAGSAAMASGGMGDVLSGVVGALRAQGLSPAAAARLATVLHSSAADDAARAGRAALLAADLMPALARLLP